MRRRGAVEYGLRLALGASRVGSIGWSCGRPHGSVVWELSLAFLEMLGIVPLLDRWVFGISRFDPVTFVSVAAVLCLTTTLAALGPAMRASRSRSDGELAAPSESVHLNCAVHALADLRYFTRARGDLGTSASIAGKWSVTWIPTSRWIMTLQS
jgi:hypothetical protein